MAGTKISELPVATTLTGAELVPVVQSGATKQTTLAQMPYVPDGTGAVTTTVQSKLRETVSVKDFGAVGDGVTDDTAAIQAALATGKNIVGTPGDTYKFIFTIAFATTYQVLDLRGAVLKPVGTFNAIRIDASNAGIKNGRIDCSGLTGNVVYNTTAIQQSVLEDLILLNPGSTTAIIFKDIFTSWFKRVSITGHAGTAFHVYSSILGTPVNSLWLEDFNISGGTGAADSMLLEAVSGVRVINPSFQNNASGGNNIRIKSTVNAGVSGVLIDGMYCEDGVSKTGSCVYVGDPTSGSNDHTGVKIVGSKFQTSKQPIKIGTNVNNDILITQDEFVSVTGSPAYAVAPGSTTPNCYSNTGSQSDINRAFTPGLTFGGGNTGMTGAFSGRYKRIGNLMTGEVKIVLTAKGSSTGSAVITGLPLAASANSFQNGAYSPISFNMATLGGSIIGRIGASSAAINLAYQGAANSTDLAETNFTNTSNVYMQFSYEL